MEIVETDEQILGAIGDERGTKLYYVVLRVAQAKDEGSRKWYPGYLGEVFKAAQLEISLERLVSQDLLSYRDLNRANARELIYAFLPKGKLAYEALLKKRLRLQQLAVVA